MPIAENSASDDCRIANDLRAPPRLPRRLLASIATLLVLGAASLLVYRYSPLRTFPERASEATALVEAVYRFRNDTGLWPENLSELIPAYSQEIPVEWKFIWGGYDDEHSSCLRLLGPLHMKLEYEFRSEAIDPAGWRATCEGDPLRVTVRQSAPSLTPPDENDRRKMALRVLERRVQREPEYEGHRAALARFAPQ